MATAEKFRYDGKHALVVGGATGMGAAAAKAAAELGAEVTVLDHAPVGFEVHHTGRVDLRDPESIDAAVAALERPVDALFAAAGVADGPDVMKINFIGHRHLIDRLRERGSFNRGAAICFISSVGGIGWESDLERLNDFLATPSFETAVKWISEHDNDTGSINSYPFSKQALNTYVAAQAYPFIKEGIRINAICPGPTDTPLSQANADLWLSFGEDYRQDTGLDIHTPEQMADVMVFLNSAAASAISGVNVLVDHGHVMSSRAGAFAPGKPIVDFLMHMEL
ncbi:SDR family oxidoreductase [Mycobacterium sp. EPa45]|uniref:SDR family oxidoreductase n=1 Tax=Mycobacterium sp. EPa45 TaxID=1545728 RepID=UPI0006423397|nr:SDR family oxidoreductase [Mycobacterium sp. EPa45]AKK25496.1 short-chain dehydrogenase [Mycobacterium sp. EPa45]